MTTPSKLCDAADWFRSDVLEIIENELREVPRFHRKQWESAMIFLSLRSAGKLGPDKLGLSMGGGKELIAYALAPHTQQLTITDLYEMNTSWDCAKTSDPDEFIRQNKPFPVDDAKMRALRMDMRQLDFPDNTFDFCYSTCAIEHIGLREDFLQHFNEVARVLKRDGVYVFTTEVSYDAPTIRDEHNHVFSLQDLHEILAESDLAAAEVFDARITPHKINYPTPSTLKQLSHFGPENFTERFLQEAPHIQLLRGKHPFTCGLFVVQKKVKGRPVRTTTFTGLSESRAFVQSGVKEFQALLGTSRVSINPFGLLPGEKSRFCSDHTEFFSTSPNQPPDLETPFHTDYFWWGKGKRMFEVALRVDGTSIIGTPEIELRIHRFRTLASKEVDCVATSSQSVRRIGWLIRTMQIDLDEDYCYAVLAKVRDGSCIFDRIEVKSYPIHLSRSAGRETLVTASTKQESVMVR